MRRSQVLRLCLPCNPASEKVASTWRRRHFVMCICLCIQATKQSRRRGTASSLEVERWHYLNLGGAAWNAWWKDALMFSEEC